MGHHRRLYARAADTRSPEDKTWDSYGVAYCRVNRMNRTAEPDGDWLRFEDMYSEGGITKTQRLPNAAEISKTLATVTIDFVVQTRSETLEIACFDRGARVRGLVYVHGKGWVERSGNPLSFEHSVALGKWLERRELLPSDHAYEVMECFLGRDSPPHE